MGDKIASKRLAEAARVSTIPGFTRRHRGRRAGAEIARGIGYPVPMIKASAGGARKGCGSRETTPECRDGYIVVPNEAKNAFGDDRVFIEKFIVEAAPHR